MTVKVAINGFGRIGRNVLRAIIESGRKDIEVVAINDLGPVETNAHLLRYDSVHGRFPHKVTVKATPSMSAAARSRSPPIAIPPSCPGGGVDVALECTGLFTTQEKASAHLADGAKRVLISAPCDGADITVVYGVNHNALTKRRPRRLQRLLHDELPGAGRLRAQQGHRHRAGLHDDDPRLYGRPADARHPAQGSLPRPRRGAVDDPDLDRCGQGRRPRAAGTRRASSTARRSACRPRTSRSSTSSSSPRRRPPPKRSTRPSRLPPRASSRASSPIPRSRSSRSTSTTTPHSSTFDSTQTKVIDGNLVRVLAWYDNEWGFSNRMCDTAVAMGKLI